MVFGKVNEETPDYTVMSEHPDNLFEVRQYGPTLEAFTSMSTGSEDKGNNNAFWKLAKYIGVFGTPQNSKTLADEPAPEAIAMTAPVVMRPHHQDVPQAIAMTAPVVMRANPTGSAGQGDDEARMQDMSFILPSKFTLETAPRPTDSAVQLRERPGRVMAVHRYSGRSNARVARDKAQELLARLRETGIEVVGGDSDWEFYGYNPPFTLPPLRRNEVAFEVVAPARLTALNGAAHDMRRSQE